jgi:DNA-binding IclR family transcriptional regulator
VQSLERAFKILECLSEEPRGLKITRLAERVGLSKSTVHRLLATLMDLDYVLQDRESEKYKLGYKALYLSRNLISGMDIITIAKPFLEDLAKDVNETVHLCIEDKGEVLYIDKIESNQTIRMISQIGNRAPMYCTGVGKVLLSGMSEEQFNIIAEKTDYIVHTPTTITNQKQLAEECKLIRKQGFAIDNSEHEEEIRCIAAPIFDSEGKIVASFSIAGPSNRITKERINNELKEKTRETSSAISKLLGYRAVVTFSSSNITRSNS